MNKINSRIAAFLLAISILTPHFAQGAFEAADVIGQRRSGSPSFTINGADGAPNDSGLNYPMAVAVDEVDRRMFVADGNNSRILVYGLTSNGLLATTTPSHVLGAPDAFTLGTEDLTAENATASALAYDAQNSRLFVASGQNRVMVFDVATSTITNGQAASYVLGSPNFTSIPANGGTAATMRNPEAVVYDSINQRLFVAEASNRRITVFDVATSTISNGQAASYVLGHDSFTTQIPGPMSSSTFADAGSAIGPTALAYDSAGSRLFTMHAGANRVLVFDVSTSTISNGQPADYVLGQPDFDTSDPGTSESAFAVEHDDASGGLAYDADDQRLFVSDSGNNRVLVFDVSAVTNGMVASNVLGQEDFVSADAGTSASAVSGPGPLAYHSAGDKLMTVDTANNRVLIFDAAAIADNEPAVDVAGHVIDGEKTFLYGGGDNGPGPGGLDGNSQIVLDTVAHRLFVADGNNHRVLAFNLDANNNLLDYDADYVLGQSHMYADSSGISSVKMTDPKNLAIDVAGRRLFVGGAEDWRVLVFDIATLSNGEAAVHVLGQPDFTSASEPATTTARTLLSGGLLYEANSDRLFVSDNYSGRVLVFDASPSALADYMPASYVLGKADFAESSIGDSSGMNTSSTMSYPAGLAYDVDFSRLFAIDKTFRRVLVFDAATSTIANGMAASYVLGQPDFASTDGGTSSSSLAESEGLAYDARNKRLFVADTVNSRVLGFNVAPSSMVNGKAANVVLGQENFDSSDADVGVASLNFPRAVAYDAGNKRLYISDTGNNRIVAYDHVKIVTRTLPDATVGESYEQDIDTENEQGTVSFDLTDGELPPGMVIGSVDGTPTEAGTYTFTIEAADNVSQVGFLSDLETYSLTVLAAADSGSGGSSSGGSGGGGGIIGGPRSSSTSPTSTPSTTPGFSDPLQAQIEALKLQLAALQARLGIPSSGASPILPGNLFMRDLFVGSTGADVKALQQFLNQKGFPVALTGPGSAGQETEQFGALTRAALAKFQAANGIVPPAGYFGPKTRAFVNGLLSAGQ